MLHGHAHAGTEKGMTPGGIQIRNVAQPVLGRAYATYHIGPHLDGGPPGNTWSAPARR